MTEEHRILDIPLTGDAEVDSAAEDLMGLGLEVLANEIRDRRCPDCDAQIQVERSSASLHGWFPHETSCPNFHGVAGAPTPEEYS